MEHHNVSEAKRQAQFHYMMAKLFQAWADGECHCDPRKLVVKRAQLQESYYDVTGWAIAHPSEECAERAAGWIHAYLVKMGETATSTSLWMGLSRTDRPLPAPTNCNRAEDALRDVDGKTHAFRWIETGMYSIGD